jgi:hypothetical protein
MGSEMSEDVRGGRRLRILLGGLAFCAAAVAASVAFAAAERPTISGEPKVGQTLTSSVDPAEETLYRWQGCDPAVANCSDSLAFPDSNWTDLTGPSHSGFTYLVAASDLGHFIRVLIKNNSTGTQWLPSAPVGPVTQDAVAAPLLPPPPPPPPPGLTPDHGITILVEPAGGNPKFKPPGQGTFTPLNNLEEIPVNSVVDTRGAKVKVTAATGDLGNTTADNSIFFYDGLIKLKQGAAQNAPAVAKLVQKLGCKKRKAGGAKAQKSGGPVATTARKRRRRRVWGSGSGNYSTSGSGGTGSVRGTTWLTKDTCRGTFFKVTEGIGISVLDFDLDKQVELGPGQSYFARNR